MTIDKELEKVIDRIGKQIARVIKKTIEADDGFDKLMGYQCELEDGTIYQVPFKVLKTNEQQHYDRCMMINANIIRKTELLEEIRHELVSISGLYACDVKKEEYRMDTLFQLDYSKLIERIDNEIDRNKDVE